MPVIYYDDKSLTEHATVLDAIAHVKTMTRRDTTLVCEGKTMVGTNDEKVAYYAGNKLYERDTEQEVIQMVQEKTTLFEHRYKKGDIKKAQLHISQVTQLDSKLATIGR